MAEQGVWGTLKALKESDKIKSVALTFDKTGYVIGRHVECDIRVDLPQLSKRHCVIFQVSVSDGVSTASVFVEDLSTNGTFVNFKRIGKGKRHKLSEGDLIQLSCFHLHTVWIFRLPTTLETNSFDEAFELDQQLGSGNFAVVKLGRHRSTSHLHAVKILDKKIFAGNAKVMQNIEQEISILMGLNHPCIIKIHQVYNLPKTINIVMEYAKGGELFDRIIDQTKFSEHQSRILMTQLFRALEYLHDRGIVHRDLKPENILLVSKSPEDLRIKISDFGLAKLIPEQNFLKTLCGTPNYVAPEVLKGGKDTRAYGSAVDLWSCGVILYICLVGQPPFSDELAPPSMLDQIKQGKFNFPSPWWDDISPEAIDLIKKLIIVDPTSRLTAAQALQHPWM
ncbi:kinase-like domain-containing protein, partial [Obelidium mucronatum]